MFCMNCGKELPDNIKICYNCGSDPNVKITLDYNNNSKIKSSNYIISNTYNKTNLTKPVSVVTFLIIQALFMIPFVNLFFMIFLAFRKDVNENIKSYSKACLIWASLVYFFIIFVMLILFFMRYPLFRRPVMF